MVLDKLKKIITLSGRVQKKGPTPTYKNRLINIFRPWKGKMLHQLCLRIYQTSEDTPRFYRLPKIHKNDALLHPIVNSSIGSISCNMAKFPPSVLHPLIGSTIHTIKDSDDFVRNLESVEMPPTRKMMMRQLLLPVSW